jgi:putative PIG3 family NAD(P)H quinone oxidoreductase
MRAVLLHGFGGSDQLYIGETQMPFIHDPDFILVQIKAAGINRADLLQRMGQYPPHGASSILGLEMAGIVEEVGENVKQWKKGDRVVGLLSGGGYAQYCVIHSDMVIEIPDDMTFEEAAAIPEAFLTAYQALIELGNIKENETILIHAAASGVGIATIQLALLKNLNIFITAGSEDKINFCKNLGVTDGVNYKDGPWISKVRELTNNEGVNLVIDFIGKDYFSQNLEILKTDGRLIMLSFLSGSHVSEIDLAPILRKRLNILGSTLRNRSLQYKINLTQQFKKLAWDAFNTKRIKPIISNVFNWEQISDAHEYMEQNKNIGKIIINGM